MAHFFDFYLIFQTITKVLHKNNLVKRLYPAVKYEDLC